MADATEAIMAALFSRMASLVLSPTLPISWPNLTFTPPASQKYLEVKFVPNTNNRAFIGSNDPHQHLGYLQVNVHWPKGVGEADLRAIAGKVVDHFPCDLTLGVYGVRITAEPSTSDLIVGNVDALIAVLVPWECWA